MQTWTCSQPNAEVAIDHAGLSAGDAMPHRANTAELLDLDVDELTRVFALVAPDRFSGFQHSAYSSRAAAEHVIGISRKLVGVEELNLRPLVPERDVKRARQSINSWIRVRPAGNR